MDVHELLGKLGGEGRKRPRVGAVESSGTPKAERDARRLAAAQAAYEEEMKALQEGGSNAKGNEQWRKAMRRAGRL